MKRSVRADLIVLDMVLLTEMIPMIRMVLYTIPADIRDQVSLHT
jgi:hypothetical protein